MKEFVPIGESFEYKGKKYKVVKSIGVSCEGCDLWTVYKCYALKLACTKFFRNDNTNVIFKEIK